MKKITFILFALIAGTTFAQDSNSADAAVNLEIVAPISLSSAGILNFGKISKLGTTGTHDVVLTTAGARLFTGTSPLISGTAATNPTFTVSNNTYAYNVTTSISQPGTGLILSTVTTDLSDESNATATSFKIGATLTIDDATVSTGEDNTGVITMTVNYN